MNYIVPILDEILTLLVSFMEVTKAKLSYEISVINKKIQEVSNNNSSTIGFSYEEEVELEEQ